MDQKINALWSTNASKEEEDKKEQEDILARWMNQSRYAATISADISLSFQKARFRQPFCE